MFKQMFKQTKETSYIYQIVPLLNFFCLLRKSQRSALSSNSQDLIVNSPL